MDVTVEKSLGRVRKSVLYLGLPLFCRVTLERSFNTPDRQLHWSSGLMQQFTHLQKSVWRSDELKPEM